MSQWFTISDSDDSERRVGELGAESQEIFFEGDLEVSIERADGDVVRVMDPFGVIVSVSNPKDWPKSSQGNPTLTFKDGCDVTHTLTFFTTGSAARRFRGM
jgi:hypothetical protein